MLNRPCCSSPSRARSSPLGSRSRWSRSPSVGPPPSRSGRRAPRSSTRPPPRAPPPPPRPPPPARLAGETPDEIRARLTAEWVEGAHAAAAERVRRIEAGANDPEHGRTAKRMMEIAIARYQGHYLTERLLTNVPIPPGSLPRIA